jgi:hypothetical protein
MAKGTGQASSTWSPLDGGIADEKIRHYLNAANNDVLDASEMFYLDGRIAACMLEPIRLFELVMREAIHKTLSQIYGPFWMLKQECIDKRSYEKAKKSESRVGKDSSKIVSDLDFGFWSGILQKGGASNQNERWLIKHKKTLWNPGISKVFSHDSPQFEVISKMMNKTNYLRNRIAHHEPLIFGITIPGSIRNGSQLKQEPLTAYTNLVQLSNYLDPHLGEHILDKFIVVDLLSDSLSKRALGYAKSKPKLEWI